VYWMNCSVWKILELPQAVALELQLELEVVVVPGLELSSDSQTFYNSAPFVTWCYTYSLDWILCSLIYCILDLPSDLCWSTYSLGFDLEFHRWDLGLVL